MTLGFYDAPANPCLPGGNTLLFCGGFANAPGSFMAFTTSLVGIYQGGGASPTLLDSTGNPLQWSWIDTYNGTSGGIPATFNNQPVDPGGAGGVAITKIGNRAQTPPSIDCSASPNVLWPPDGKSTVVSLSGTVLVGTSSLVGSTYSVIDEYGLIHPTGNVNVGQGGQYSVAIPLIADRNGNDQDGRTYTITIVARDMVGNAASCSATVIVPHDLGHE